MSENRLEKKILKGFFPLESEGHSSTMIKQEEMHPVNVRGIMVPTGAAHSTDQTMVNTEYEGYTGDEQTTFKEVAGNVVKEQPELPEEEIQLHPKEVVEQTSGEHTPDMPDRFLNIHGPDLKRCAAQPDKKHGGNVKVIKDEAGEQLEVDAYQTEVGEGVTFPVRNDKTIRMASKRSNPTEPGATRNERCRNKAILQNLAGRAREGSNKTLTSTFNRFFAGKQSGVSALAPSSCEEEGKQESDSGDAVTNPLPKLDTIFDEKKGNTQVIKNTDKDKLNANTQNKLRKYLEEKPPRRIVKQGFQCSKKKKKKPQQIRNNEHGGNVKVVSSDSEMSEISIDVQIKDEAGEQLEVDAYKTRVQKGVTFPDSDDKTIRMASRRSNPTKPVETSKKKYRKKDTLPKFKNKNTKCNKHIAKTPLKMPWEISDHTLGPEPKDFAKDVATFKSTFKKLPGRTKVGSNKALASNSNHSLPGEHSGVSALASSSCEEEGKQESDSRDAVTSLLPKFEGLLDEK